MASNRKWTSQDDEDLLYLTQAGYCADTVGMVLGRTASAVQSRLGQLRRATVGPVPEDATAVDLHERVVSESVTRA